MIELAADYQRSQADLELRFLQAVRIAVPACLDKKSQPDYEKREAALLKLTQF